MAIAVAEKSAATGSAIDRALERSIRTRLGASPYSPVRCVQCRCEGDTLTLRGQVPSYHTMQVVLNLVRSQVSARIQIENRMTVESRI